MAQVLFALFVIALLILSIYCVKMDTRTIREGEHNGGFKV